jgi:hypothetical protein
VPTSGTPPRGVTRRPAASRREQLKAWVAVLEGACEQALAGPPGGPAALGLRPGHRLWRLARHLKRWAARRGLASITLVAERLEGSATSLEDDRPVPAERLRLIRSLAALKRAASEYQSAVSTLPWRELGRRQIP